MTEEEQWHRDTAVRFAPYDCSACFDCWKSKWCIYASYTSAMTEDEIKKCRKQERLLLWGLEE